MAEIRQRPAFLPTAEQVRRVPIGDRTVDVLPVPVRVGTVESEAGGVRVFGLRAGDRGGRNPTAVSGRRAVGGDIVDPGGKGRGQVGAYPGTRGGN